MSGERDNEILSVVERWWASRYSERHGLVTSYDPDKHLAKVTFQPEGQESGWLPIETGHIGNGFGIAIGLTPGDGKSTGDQVIVRYQEGDFESGKIVQRVHSDEDKPPRVESGEMVFWHEKGAKIFFAKDGSLTAQDGKGASIVFDGQGNINDVAKKKTEKFSSDHNVSVGGDKNVSVGGQRVDQVSAIWNAVAKFGIWSWLTAGSDVTD
jgi:phage baseplate assembly protein gpV